MNLISWRHHYIPQFYLNGFTNGDGTFKVYDIKNQKFIKNGKEFHPNSYFFEKNGNLLVNDDGLDDMMEKRYGKIDNETSIIFNKINNSTSETDYDMTDDDIVKLQYFVSVMYWRIPSHYQKIESIIDQKKLKNLGLVLKNSNDEIVEPLEGFEKWMKKNPNFKKMMKYWFPLISFPEIFDCETKLHIWNSPKGLPSICGDNPIICQNPDSFNVYRDDYIFPVNNTKLFMRGNNLQSILSSVRVEVDTLIYKQSLKYVGCTDERYIELLENFYLKHYSNLNQLRDSIFFRFFNNTPLGFL